jgi:sterol desaturase/sphingolipid hydroxylase (fatty acid hydroxylase superfamily)
MSLVEGLREYWLTGLQAGVLVVFLGVGGLHARVVQTWVGRETVVNVGTGALLYGLRIAVVFGVGAAPSLGLISMDAVTHPLLQWGIAFLLLDLLRYFVHWLDHRVPWLWMFHRVHHSSERLDATSGLRMHAVDLLQLTAIPLVLYSVLLDTTSFAPWVVEAALAVGVVFDAFQHANIRMDMTRPLNRAWNTVLNNPHFHCWHHTRDGALRDGNYGNVLTIWDRIFGTEVTGDLPPEHYGLPGSQQLQQSVLSLQLLRSA